MNYRVGNHNRVLVYGEPEDAEHYTPRPHGELVAVFVREGGENELDALHYVRAMNATMPGCTCRVICCCGALVGTTSGCETCAEHEVECAPNADDRRATAYRSARAWAAENGHQQPDDRMIDAALKELLS
jgi:hypothetical protein